MIKWDENERNAAIKIAGLFTAALAVFLFLASFSYLFHWKEDMSLLNDPSMMDAATGVENVAGKLGYRTGRLLICRLFGFGSFALIVILVAASIRLLLHRWQPSLIKTTLICLGTAFVASLALSFTGSLCGIPNAFEGGLGGMVGTTVNQWGINLFGRVVTGILIALLICVILFCCSQRFNRWIASWGAEKPEEEKEEEPAPEPEQPEPVVQETVKQEPENQEDETPVAETLAVVPERVTPKPVEIKETESGVEGSLEIITDDTLDAGVVKELKPMDNRLDPPEGLPRYKFPSIDLLEAHASGRKEVSSEELTRNNNKIRSALKNYKIEVVDVKAIVGPTVTLYKVYPAPGVQIAQIKRLQEDIALSLNAKGVRVVTLSDSVGIEVANDFSSTVALKALLNDDSFRESKADLPVAIGYTITQKVKVFDLADAPHLLVAGATKQGKSVGLNVIINSLLFAKHPSELKFVFIDPKMVEFAAYGQLLKHYLAVLPDAGDEDEERERSIVKKPKDAERILRSLCQEMDERYELMSKAGANNVKLYNDKYKTRKLNPQNGHRYLPYIVVVVDEYADLTMTTGASSEARAASRSITNSIIRLAQKGRAAGLHVILATQRPSVDVISGVIKSNFPMRIAFRVASRIDSMTILDAPGAEKLIGKGDMLFSAGIDTERIQCAFISGEEIECITSYIGEQKGLGKSYNTPYYLPVPADDEGGEQGGGMVDMSKLDDRFEEAARMVVMSQRGSTSDLQRKLGMGYAKAGRVMDQLEAAGIVGPQEGSKPRQVLVADFNALQTILDSFMK
ncbi:MAG: DNA translocase FtsK [Bacteroidales bacterium]|nr:DNA translocase FtsK [Bacteroidales bacterium]